MTTTYEREAAKIISDLLAQSLRCAETQNRHLYCWERSGIEWLREQWRIGDPDTWGNSWTIEKYVLNAALELNGKMKT